MGPGEIQICKSIEEMTERIDYDLYYLKNSSLLFDLKILMLTVGTILKGKGM